MKGTEKMLEKLKNNWQTIKKMVRDEYGIIQVSYDTWIQPMEIANFKNNTLYVTLSTEATEWSIGYATKRFTDKFQIVIEEFTDEHISVVFQAETKKQNHLFNTESEDNYDVTSYKTSNINPKYTFDTFVVGANNQMAHAASISVAEKPGKEFNPLFIYGGSGLGKTHLMYAIANFIYKNNPSSKVIYVTSESFMNEVIESIHKKNDMTYFKKKYRNVDVLLIDDIQFLIGRGEIAQEEFFNTFNYLCDNGKQIVISSDKPPKEFTNIEDRMKSRFERGLIVDISLPDYETRMAILRGKVEQEGYSIDNEILNYIATNIKSNIRALEGALTKISAYSKLNPEKIITLDVAKEHLKDLIDPESEQKLTPENIINVVANYYNVRPEDIKSKKRSQDVTTPRHVAMYLIRKMTDNTLEDVGKVLGNRDHTTIKYGFEKISDEIKSKDDLKSTIEILRKKILQ